MVDASTIKGRLRINHNQIDSQLSDDIAAAKAELIRLGIDSTKVNSTTTTYPLLDKAIIAYCLWIEASDEKASKGYEAMWNLWRDELRKSPEYKASEDV